MSEPDRMVEAAEAEQDFGQPIVTSGDRGRPMADLLAKIEDSRPDLTRDLDLSSAAMRAGAMVRAMRKARGLTQTALAEKLGWTQERISNIERGVGAHGPTFDVLHQIADACCMSMSFVPNEEGNTLSGIRAASAARSRTNAPQYQELSQTLSRMWGPLLHQWHEALYAPLTPLAAQSGDIKIKLQNPEYLLPVGARRKA